MSKKVKNIILLSLITAISLALGILLCIDSVWSDIIKLIIAIGLISYLAFILIPRTIKLKSGRKITIAVVENVLVALIALGLIFAQFEIIKIGIEMLCFIGFVLWLRGVADIMMNINKDDTTRNNILLTSADIVLITFGTFIFAKPFITNDTLRIILIVFAFLVFLLAVLGIVLVASNKIIIRKKSITKK